MSAKLSFFAELKRRNVYKVAVAYAVVGWLIMQVAATVVPALHLSDAITSAVVVLVFLGFPIALVLAWAFEITPEGIKLESEVPAHESITRQTGRRIVGLTIIVAVIAAGLFAFQFFRPRLTSISASGARAIPEKSIAVLPFENLSDDKTNAYFADGIQDEILTRLTKIGALKVISRTSTAHYASSPENLPEIARQLGVAHMLEGSVQKSGDAVRVNVQLIKAANDSHLWADTFDRKLTNVFGVESEIAKSIADTLRVKLSAPEAQALNARPTENSQAHELYLKGMYFWNRRNATDLRKALDFFNQAIALDPNYALAWSGVAQVYVLLPLYGGDSPTEALPKSKEAAHRAIALDPTLGAPHATLGNIYTTTFEFAASIREFEKAIELDPNDATTHHWFGDSVLECIGDNNRAIAEHKRALELDPLSLAINIDLAYSYYMAARYPEAIAQIHKALELDPYSYAAHYNLGWILQASGDLPAAIAEYRKAVALDSDPFALALLGHAEALAGNRHAGLEILQELTVAKRYVPDYSVALVYLGLGEKDRAMDWLEKSIAEGQPDLNVIRFDPLLKSLHGNPRFEALAEKIAPARVIAALTRSSK